MDTNWAKTSTLGHSRHRLIVSREQIRLNQSTTNVSCKDSRIGASHLKHLVGATSSKPLAPVLAKLAASALIIASAGFGAYYAGSLGAEQGPLLAVLSIAMAIGLEVAKPFSIAMAFEACRSSHICQGVAVALLGIVAISYSLSAELSLWATMRSDRIAMRAAESNVATSARDQYQRAKLELDGLPSARPAAELQSLIDGVLIDPRAGGCAEINGKYTREHCAQVAEWKAEQARSERRDQLQHTIREAERVFASGSVVKTADPGATALATYLAIFGLKVEPGLLTELLILVGVVASELGSALSLVLVQAVSGGATESQMPGSRQTLNSAPEPEPVVQVVHPTKTDDAASCEKVKAAILNQLEQRGGSLGKSERGIAALIGASRPTVRRAINGLVIAGLIAAEASRNGTMLRLVT